MTKRYVRYKGPKGGLKDLTNYLKLSEKQKKKFKKVVWFE